MEIEYHPLNFGALNKGDIVSVEIVERAVGCLRGSPLYNIRALTLRDRVAREIADRGKPACVVLQKDGTLKVLTDSEAVSAVVRRRRTGLRRVVRAFAQERQIDPSQLTEAEVKTWNRNVVVHGAELLALRSARGKAIAAIVHQRKTPALLPSESK